MQQKIWKISDYLESEARKRHWPAGENYLVPDENTLLCQDLPKQLPSELVQPVSILVGITHGLVIANRLWKVYANLVEASNFSVRGEFEGTRLPQQLLPGRTIQFYPF